MNGSGENFAGITSESKPDESQEAMQSIQEESIFHIFSQRLLVCAKTAKLNYCEMSF